MYKFRGSLGVKLTAMILFVFFLFAALLLGAGITFSAYSGVYFDGGKRLMETAVEDAVYKELSAVSQDIINAIDPAAGQVNENALPDELFDGSENFSVVVTDMNSGDIIYESAPVGESGYEAELVVSVPHYSEAGSISFDNYSDAADYAVSYAKLYPSFESFSIRVDNSRSGDTVYTFSEPSQQENVKHYRLCGRVDLKRAHTGGMKAASTVVGLLVQYRFAMIWLCIGSVVLMLVLFVFLMCSAGRKSGVPGIYLCWSDRIPFDIVLAFLALLACLTAAVLDFFSYTSFQFFIALFAAAVVWVFILMCNIVSFAARAKAGDWWKNTVIFKAVRLVWRTFVRVCYFLGYAFMSVPMAARYLSLWLVYSAFEAIIIVASMNELTGEFVIAYGILKILVAVALTVALRHFSRLKKAGEILAKGDTECNIDKRYMAWDIRKHAENLESIGCGINLAVEREIKSERMKTELITNVSHDIKTPLTSIINYVDLLKKEDIDNETASSYIEVIERQSTRLKKLTEDLVEASKVSSGAVSVNASPTDIGVLLSQGFGEYEERMTEKGLKPILSAEGGHMANVDGKLLWRVFDNLFSNICKYAMTGTRVYVSERINGKCVSVIFRNISGSPIEISGEELTERFVRADRSRSTEGSGLGLSISKSLTKLMGGSFDVSVDGDLFKVIIEFPVCSLPDNE